MRKPFLDNLRYSVVLLVVFYHVCYLFNSVGVLTNVSIPGIPAMDAVLYLCYPWFMITQFVISGACARYTLQKQTHKQFLKSKARRQLLPSIAGIFVIGWVSGWVTNQYTDMFAGNGDQIPGVIKYLIWCVSGTGALWFLHELFLANCLLVLIRKIDKKDRLWQLGGRIAFPVLCLLSVALWGSAQILNTPLIEVYRHGIYLFSFLIGYCVFSHECVHDMLAKAAPFLLAVAGVLAACYTVYYWGENYASMSCLQSLPTNLFAWFGMLAVFGVGKRWMDSQNAFTRYMTPRSFGIFALHYPFLALGAWTMDRLLHWPVWSMYIFLPAISALLLPAIIILVKKTPVVRMLLLGE